MIATSVHEIQGRELDIQREHKKLYRKLQRYLGELSLAGEYRDAQNENVRYLHG
jgi:hypothetical protein